MKNLNRSAIQAKFGIAAMAGALLMSAIVSPAAADTVRWRTIIGIEDAGNLLAAVGNNTVSNNNAVGGIPGGGQAWSTLGGRARVDLATSQVSFEVEGLVLAGGNTIGTPGAINQVKGTIVCDAGAPTQHVIDTPLVTLNPQGDAEFSGATILPIPSSCNSTNVVFLVRIAAGRWIANGAVRSSSN
jgi:hypothetical protein